MVESLDSALKARLRAVLDGRPVTETELRSLAEEGRACALILNARLERGEQRLGELCSDPGSSLSDIAATLRDMNELRPDLEELHAFLAALEGRAREFRTAWVSPS